MYEYHVCVIMCVHVPEYGICSFVFYDYPVFIFIFKKFYF